MYKKNIGRTTYKSNRRTTFKKSGYQNFKGRNKGNISQQYNKYLKLAKEAFRSGDRVQSEYYYQFTDHYYRLMIELGINIEDTSQLEELKEISTEEKDNSNSDVSSNEPETEKESNQDSIESIPFIAEPSKDKRTRSNK
tara:strand:- start:132 stop:548 length:417 start_codon:yes stop_codon:yes gene_type:complete